MHERNTALCVCRPLPTDYDCLKHGTPFVPFFLLNLPPCVNLTIPTTLLPIPARNTHSLNIHCPTPARPHITSQLTGRKVVYQLEILQRKCSKATALHKNDVVYVTLPAEHRQLVLASSCVGPPLSGCTSVLVGLPNMVLQLLDKGNSSSLEMRIHKQNNADLPLSHSHQHA